MRAIVRDRYGPPQVASLAEVADPVPGPSEALVSVHAASLNTADLDHLRGRPAAMRAWSGLRTPRLRRLGLDVAGRVEAVGGEVEGLAPGDEVWADLFEFGHGAFAELVCAPARAFSPKPPSATFAEAAAVPHSGVLALQGLTGKGPVRAGERVLINGAGGLVGPLAVQLAKAFGAEVTGVDHADKLPLVDAAGADHLVDYTTEDVTRAGGRYDLILDIAATRSPRAFLRILADDGRYLLAARSLTGFLRAAVLGRWITGGRDAGVFTWRPNHRPDLERLAGMMESGELRPLLDGRYSLEEVPEALSELESGRVRGKPVVAVRAVSGP